MRYGIAILFIAFLAIIGTIVLIGRGNNSSPTAKAPKAINLVDYADKDSATVSWTLQGRMVGEDARHSVRVTVTKSRRTVEILDGYEETTERSKDFQNTPDAFAYFMHALQVAGYGRQRVVKQTDDRGVCPLGNTVIYRLEDNGKEVIRSWSDNCETTDGTFAGSAGTTDLIFKAQITDYNKFVSGVIL